MVDTPSDEPVAAANASLPSPPASDPLLGRRAQILATEHWGLLAARGTAQSEVLTRITIYLTLVSAGLVTIGLLAQATGFRDWFAGAFLSILGFLTLIGLMTQTRVFNVAEEDLMYVVAMTGSAERMSISIPPWSSTSWQGSLTTKSGCSARTRSSGREASPTSSGAQRSSSASSTAASSDSFWVDA